MVPEEYQSGKTVVAEVVHNPWAVFASAVDQIHHLHIQSAAVVAVAVGSQLAAVAFAVVHIPWAASAAEDTQ